MQEFGPIVPGPEIYHVPAMQLVLVYATTLNLPFLGKHLARASCRIWLRIHITVVAYSSSSCIMNQSGHHVFSTFCS